MPEVRRFCVTNLNITMDETQKRIFSLRRMSLLVQGGKVASVCVGLLFFTALILEDGAELSRRAIIFRRDWDAQ